MSEFIKRIQDRLKSSKQAPKQEPDAASKSGKPNYAQSPLAISLNRLIPTSPANLTKFVTYLLMLACAISATYWLMRLVQIPGTPNQPSNGISKGLTLYSNQDATAGYALFGSKPLVTENIYLRGVVATSKNPDGSLDGFAIFEIDGKPTNAISVGETIGKGLSLQSIGDESAILLYQGQRLSFKLNKATKDKSDKTSSSNKK
ncbi:hypothetical protein AOC28_06825 [Polynucleobacter sp. MWH-Adler-W8]|nr:hypothetical protein AOC28_06825 [Polynucleobacter sp. MWH-Adler-W8]